MFRGYWVAGIALGLAFALLPPQNAGAQQQDQPAQEQVTVPPPAFGLIEQPQEPDQLTNPCEPGEDNRNSDLCAQWKAADAADKSANWAGPTFWLGIVGAGIGVFTLVAAVGAAIFAKSAANATWKTVEVTRGIGEAQTRAYLNCTSAKYQRGKDSVSAHLRIENIGNSPATGVEIVGDVTLHDVAGRPSHTRVTRWVAAKRSRSPCQPIVTKGSTLETITFFWDYDFAPNLNEDDDLAFKRDAFETGNEIWFDLTIRYRDVFGKINSVPLSLEAIIDAHPLSPNKKRSRTGKLSIRIEDGRVNDDSAYQPASD